MEILTIDEVIEHCSKTCDMTEGIAKARGHELESIESNQFWEHYQVRAWLKELKQYKYLEEQGLLLRLPCKVGTKVYAINIIIDYGEIGDEATYSYSIIEREFQIYMMMDYGKLVFLTQTEADQKLKEMENR